MSSETLVTQGVDGDGRLVTVTLTIERHTPTVFSVDAPGNDLPAHRAAYGQLGHTRFFFGPNKRFGWGAFPLTNRAPDDVPVVSAKTWYPSEFEAMLNTTPDDVPEWYMAYFHEPEDDITDGTLTIEQFESTYAQMREIRDAHPHGGRCRLLICLNWFQLTQRGFDWTRLAGAIKHADIIGVDAYALKDAALRLNTYTPAAELFGPAIDIAEATGLPWCVPEFGCVIAADGNAARHASQVQAYIDYAGAHAAKWVALWCNDVGAYQPHWCTEPAYASALAVWKTAMRGA